jgi:uncharacterized membrane protein
MGIELVVATFEDDESQAGEALKHLEQLAADKVLQLEHVAVVTKREDGEVEVEDVGDVDSQHGAVFGAITGGLIGLIAGPVGAIAGALAGAAAGGVTANLADYGVSDDIINAVKEGLQPGSSALIVYVDLTRAATVIDELDRAGATVVNQALDDEALGS